MTNKIPESPEHTPKVLFICSGNTCRSPMAQALFIHRNRYRAPFFRVESYGTAAVDRRPISPLAKRALEDFGILNFNHFSRSIEDYKFFTDDLIFCLGENHRNCVARRFPLAKNLFLLREFLDGQSVADPFGSSLQTYRSVCRIIFESLPSIDQFLVPIYRLTFGKNAAGLH